MTADVIRKTAALAVGGAARTATADVCFPGGPPDRDGDAYAPGCFPDVKVPGGRAHDLVSGGDAPPAFVADIRNRGNRYEATIKFLTTPRGQAEYETVKALAAEGVVQPVSMAFIDARTGSIPDALLAAGTRRYITSGRVIELSLVPVGAVPFAQITSVKRLQQHAPSIEQQRRDVAAIREKLAKAPTSPRMTQTERERLAVSLARYESTRAPVSAAKAAFARQCAREVADLAGAPTPDIVWEVSSSDHKGEFRPETPNVVYLNARLSTEEEILRVVAHEFSHVIRHRRNLPQDEWLAELDAADIVRSIL